MKKFLILAVGNLLVALGLINCQSVSRLSESGQEFDLSKDFASSYVNSNASFDQKVQSWVKDHHVIFVPGTLYDSAELKTNPGIIGEYFGDQIKVIQQLGGEYSVIGKGAEISDDESVIANSTVKASSIAAKINDMKIEYPGKRFILISHGKGSLDVLEALQGQTVVRKNVSGWISIQGLFGGAPLYDRMYFQRQLVERPPQELQKFFYQTYPKYGQMLQAGQTEGISSEDVLFFHDRHFACLNSGVCRQQIELEPEGVRVPKFKKLNEQLSLIAVTSSVAEGQPSILEGLDKFLDAREPHDYFASSESMRLPESAFVHIDGLDHINSVAKTLKEAQMDRGKMTKALLVLLYQNSKDL